MCPGIVNSCCLKEDQLRIFANWAHSKERLSIRKHFMDVQNIYFEVLREYQKVYELAQKTIKVLSYKRIANCKVLATRILSFDINEIYDQVQQNFKDLEEFFYTSYRGLYCSLCNYNNHEFFDVKNRTMIYSEKFCRDMVTSTLNTLLFFYHDLVKYNNLVSKFLLSCDKNGEFEADIMIPTDVVFVYDDIVSKNLSDCRKNRNQASWVIHCNAICEQFKWNKFASYYEPELQRYKAYIKFLQAQQIKIVNGGKATGILVENIVNKRILTELREEKQKQLKLKRRILEAKKVKKSKKGKKSDKGKEKRKLKVVDSDNHQDEAAENQKADLIFGKAFNQVHDIENFKVLIKITGLSPLDSGRNSLISSTMYNQIKTMISIEKAGPMQSS